MYVIHSPRNIAPHPSNQLELLIGSAREIFAEESSAATLPQAGGIVHVLPRDTGDTAHCSFKLGSRERYVMPVSKVMKRIENLAGVTQSGDFSIRCSGDRMHMKET